MYSDVGVQKKSLMPEGYIRIKPPAVSAVPARAPTVPRADILCE